MKRILEILFVITMLIVSASMFVWSQDGEETAVNPLEERLAQIAKNLKLDAAQVEQARAVLEKYRDRALEFRANNKTDALVLIRAGYERRNAMTAEMEKLLKPEQIDAFKKMNRMHLLERELFELTEGLMLTDDQVFAVEGILIKYYNAMWDMMPEGAREGMTESGLPSELPDGGGFMQARVLHFWDRMADKKDREILKELARDQKTLYRQITKDRRAKRKEWKKRMKERRKKLKE